MRHYRAGAHPAPATIAVLGGTQNGPETVGGDLRFGARHCSRRPCSSCSGRRPGRRPARASATSFRRSVSRRPGSCACAGAGCAFDRRPGSCRQTCRETVHELAHDCRSRARECGHDCEAVPPPPCTSSCAADARGCLLAAPSAARTCLADCGHGRRLERLNCRQKCVYSIRDDAIRCLRAAPVCIRAAKQTFRACRSACSSRPFPEGFRCQRACLTAYRGAHRDCLAHPESGLFACVPRCAGSPAGAFVGLRPPR